MAAELSIGIQDFEEIRQENKFYIDKTEFIKEWWNGGDKVTLIARPRRFGKTLNMSMLECFFSNQYENYGELFEGLSVWKDEKYRQLQGTWPVIAFSFAGVKADTYENFIDRIRIIVQNLCNAKYLYLSESDKLTPEEVQQLKQFRNPTVRLTENTLSMSIQFIASCMYKIMGRKLLLC